MVTILHNPRCSKSRETLALLESLSPPGEPITVIEYLKQPLTAPQLKDLHRQLGGPIRDMVRSNEAPYQDLHLADTASSDETFYEAIAAHPILLQRPIVVYRGKAAIGRPPESIRSLFE
jgi:arsenate reductase (glutaredoxin)